MTQYYHLSTTYLCYSVAESRCGVIFCSYSPNDNKSNEQVLNRETQVVCETVHYLLYTSLCKNTSSLKFALLGLLITKLYQHNTQLLFGRADCVSRSI